MTTANKHQAPLSNKGANAPNFATPAGKVVSVNLDWLRYTMPYNADAPQAENLQRAIPAHEAFSLTGEMLPNAKGYDSAMQLSIGVIHWHTKLASQGISVELSGSGLAQSRKAGVLDLDILTHIHAVLGHVSTMDSAIDVYNHDAYFGDILMLDELGSLETTVREVGQYKKNKRTKQGSVNDGTVYVGSPKSPRQIKIYDKASEQGKIGADWTRIEMRWRGKHARAAHRAMMQFGIASVTQKAVRSMLNADIEWFQEAITGGVAEIEPVRRPDTNTVDWLIDFVNPIIQRELASERAKGGTRLFSAISETIIAEERERKRKGVSQGRRMRDLR